MVNFSLLSTTKELTIEIFKITKHYNFFKVLLIKTIEILVFNFEVNDFMVFLIVIQQLLLVH